jgi:hypothetical protein
MLEELVHQVESRLFDLGRRLWQSGPLAGIQEEIARLERELPRQREALRTACTQRASAQKRLKINQDLIASLPALVRRSIEGGRGPEAFQHALALDRARQEITEDQTALPRLTQICWSLQFQVRQSERYLANLRRQLTAASRA